jgi:hypothetical protein
VAAVDARPCSSTGLGREDICALLDDLSEELTARGARAELFLVADREYLGKAGHVELTTPVGYCATLAIRLRSFRIRVKKTLP